MRKLAVLLLTMVVLAAMATTASARARSADLIMGPAATGHAYGQSK